MERRQLVLVLFVLGAFFLAILVASQYGQGGSRPLRGTRPRPRRQIVGTKPTPVVYSNGARDDDGDDASDEQPQDEDDPIHEEPAAHDEEPQSKTDQAVQEAMNALSPTDGIEALEAYLATLEQLDEATKAYCALGTLYAQMDPPNMGEAEGAFDSAGDLAQSPGERMEARYLLVKALMDRGEDDRAREKAAAALEQAGPGTCRGAHLRIVMGAAYEGKGALQQAEVAYEQAMVDSRNAVRNGEREAVDVYRQACLSLARVYRKGNRDREAKALARKLRLVLLEMDAE